MAISICLPDSKRDILTQKAINAHQNKLFPLNICLKINGVIRTCGKYDSPYQRQFYTQIFTFADFDLSLYF